jgi:peptidoglycan/LPS O-acetylase OafA/YrhL
MPRRIDLGRAVLCAGAALLLISLFTEWYDTGPTGWEVFETLDLVLAAIALSAVVAAIRPDAVPPAAAWALPGAALVIVIVQIVNAPPAAGDGDPSTGAWLALSGSLLMAAGSALSLAAISVTVHVREREVRRRVPAVDRRAERESAEAEDLDADADPGAGSAPRTSSGSRSAGADDLDRTQPLTSLREPGVEDPERP